MNLMGFHLVDIVIVGLIAFLAIKGLVNGFSKELLNLITIVAGVILAARYNETVVQLINEQKLVPPISDEFAQIIGFIVIIVSIWLLIGFISSIITKLTSKPSGFLSRLLGYILSAARYAFIFSLIIFGISQSDFFKKSAKKFDTETKLFKPMADIGAKILNIELNGTIIEEHNSTLIKDINISKIEKTKNSEVNLSISTSTKLTEHNSSN